MKYYMETEFDGGNSYIAIKELDETKFVIKKTIGGWYTVFLDNDERTYFNLDQIYDTIEDCFKELFYYSKKIKLPNGEFTYIK